MTSSRREFLRKSAVATTLLGVSDVTSLFSGSNARPEPSPGTSRADPWYRRSLRWGQTNIRETEPPEYDIAWWRQHRKRTQTQAGISKPGGNVGDHPIRFPLHQPAIGHRPLGPL